jgi:hypothetical protein
MVPPDYGTVTRPVPEAERDNSALEREAEEFGIEPEKLTILAPEPEFHDDDEIKLKRRQEIHRLMMAQSRERIAKRSSKNLVVKNGKLGKHVGMWFSVETLDALAELSVAWEMARTKVIVQLVRQAKGTTLKRWIGPAPGEYEIPNRIVPVEENVKLLQRRGRLD